MTDFQRPKIMGIINCTPDSFYQGSAFPLVKDALPRARKMIAEGVDIIDIGGESTRPGSSPVPPDVQIKRVVPLIREIRSISSVALSIDTCSAKVAERALDSGATMVNDVSAMRNDSRMPDLLADRRVPVVLMHIQGIPRNMQDNPVYTDIVQEVREFLKQRIDIAIKKGIRQENIILDPGIGFGKGPGDNEVLLKNLNGLRIADFPLLVGLSRKSFLGRILDSRTVQKLGYNGKSAPGVSESCEKLSEQSIPEDRLAASLAAHAWCLWKGVEMLRVHDIKETRELIAVWEALTWAF